LLESLDNNYKDICELIVACESLNFILYHIKLIKYVINDKINDKINDSINDNINDNNNDKINDNINDNINNINDNINDKIDKYFDILKELKLLLCRDYYI